MRIKRERVRCELSKALRQYWKLPEKGDIVGDLLCVGQESDGEGNAYLHACVILDLDGRVIGVEPTNLVFLEGRRIEGVKDCR